jgi:hypothetical protein
MAVVMIQNMICLTSSDNKGESLISLIPTPRYSENEMKQMLTVAEKTSDTGEGAAAYGLSTAVEWSSGRS